MRTVRNELCSLHAMAVNGQLKPRSISGSPVVSRYSRCQACSCITPHLRARHCDPPRQSSKRTFAKETVFPPRHSCRATANPDLQMACQQLDDELSRRDIALDPAGYFIISVNREEQCIVVSHYANVINSRGVACDPVTGKPIPCDGSYKPTPTHVFR